MLSPSKPLLEEPVPQHREEQADAEVDVLPLRCSTVILCFHVKMLVW